MNTISRDNISEEFDAVLYPYTLFGCNAEAVVLEACENFVEDLVMSIESGMVDRDVVHESYCALI